MSDLLEPIDPPEAVSAVETPKSDESHITKLNKESERRRLENKELKSRLASLESEIKLAKLDKHGIKDPDHIEFLDFQVSKGLSFEDAVAKVKAIQQPRNISAQSRSVSSSEGGTTTSFSSSMTKAEFAALPITEKVELSRKQPALYNRLKN